MSSPGALELWVEPEGGAGGSSQPGGFVQAFDSIQHGGVQLVDILPTSFVSTQAGTQAWVRSVKQWFDWDPTDNAAADQITKVAPTFVGGGPGRFNRRIGGHPEWEAQAAWTIDPINGNNENASTLQTWAELARRLNYPAGDQVTTSVTVRIASTLPVSDPVNLLAYMHAGEFRIEGTKTIIAAGTLTAPTTPINRATQQLTVIHDVAQTWGPLVNKLIRITASSVPANVGAAAWISRDLGGGNAESSPFLVAPTNGSFTFGTEITPALGDSYEVYDLPSVNLGTICVVPGSGVSPPAGSWMSLAWLNINGGAELRGITNKLRQAVRIHQSQLLGCIIAADQTITYSCYFPFVNLVYGPGVLWVSAGLVTGSLLATLAGQVDLQNDTLLEGANAQFYNEPGCFFTLTSACAFRNTLNGTITIGGAAIVGGLYWGTSNASHVFRVSSGSFVRYTTKPTCNAGLGAGKECLVGGTDKLWTAIPYVNPANNAEFVVDT